MYNKLVKNFLTHFDTWKMEQKTCLIKIIITFKIELKLDSRDV